MYVKTTNRKAKILLYDIETTDLNADWGECLMISWKWLNEPTVYIKTVRDYSHPEVALDTHDKPLIQDFMKILEEADVIIGHYADKFDYLFLQTRAMYHGLGPLPAVPSVDTWKIARFQLKLKSNRMANIAEFFELSQQKSSVSKRLWRLSKQHHSDAISTLADYCIQDVLTLEAVFNKLRPLATAMPNMQLLEGIEEACCPRCGSTNISKNGTRTLKANVYQRYHCNGCGAWPRAAKALQKNARYARI